MDSITQIVLGGAVGEAILGRKEGNRAIVWGAICGTIPDLDVIGMNLMSVPAGMNFHRGMSHSFFFSAVAAVFMGILIARIHKKGKSGPWQWSWLAFGALATHPLLDIFTSWGTELFWPFSRMKISFDTIFVVDPLYTLPFMILLVSAMFLNRERKLRRALNYSGILLSTLYLFFTVLNKSRAQKAFQLGAIASGIEADKIITRPTPLNNMLWMGIIEEGDHFYMSYWSILGDQNFPEKFEKYEKNAECLNPYRGNAELELQLKLTNGFYSVDCDSAGPLIQDIRYGVSGVRLDGDNKFVFSYRFNPVSMKIEQVRTMKVAREQFEELWNGITGKIRY